MFCCFYRRVSCIDVIADFCSACTLSCECGRMPLMFICMRVCLVIVCMYDVLFVGGVCV